MILKKKKKEKNLIFEFHFGKTVVEDKSKNENIFFGEFLKFFGNFENNEKSSFLYNENSFSYIELSKNYEIENFSLILNFMILENKKKINYEENEKILFLIENPFFLKISLNSKKKLKIIFSENEELISFGEFREKIWKNIIIEKFENNLSLYINGILDNSKIIKKSSKINLNLKTKISLIQKNEKNNLLISIQKIKFLKKKILEIEKKKYFNFFLPYNFFKFGCFKCNYQKATKICYQNNFQICSSLEFYSGVLKIVKFLGWDSLNYFLFTRDTVIDNSSIEGLAICCKK